MREYKGVVVEVGSLDPKIQEALGIAFIIALQEYMVRVICSVGRTQEPKPLIIILPATRFLRRC